MPRRTLDELLVHGESPYFGMFTAGRNGYPIEEVLKHCSMCGIPIRNKDIRSWEDGWFYHQTSAEYKRQPGSVINSLKPRRVIRIEDQFDSMKLSDFPTFPSGWRGTEKRFFPCSENNTPLMPWGWKEDFEPNLMYKIDAKVLSPVGWVGQNMLYQPFIVMDIDGVGHGRRDEKVIEFGTRWKNMTLTMEDPDKPGSFHLYFTTNRIIPVKHFPWAKLDLMGNAVNAAVYFKNKISNGIPAMELDEGIWNAMMLYQKRRKEQR